MPHISDLLWYVVRVKANAERKVAQSLSNRGMEAFLPVQRRLSRQKRGGRLDVPLFPGYVFARFDYHAALLVVTCPGVVHIVRRGNVAEPVDPVEMYALQSVSRMARSLEPLPAFAVGEKVRVTGGPLADVEGIVLRDNGRRRLAVSISLLRRSVVAEIEREWLDNLQTSVEIVHWAQAAV
jgi:transcription antitermination factor NusG